MIVPMGSRILVKPTPENEQTKGGLYIPEIAREKTLHGVVVATGKGAKDEHGKFQPMYIKVGQKVYYTKNATTEVMHNGSEHLLMKEDRVLLIDERS